MRFFFSVSLCYSRIQQHFYYICKAVYKYDQIDMLNTMLCFNINFQEYNKNVSQMIVMSPIGQEYKRKWNTAF